MSENKHALTIVNDSTISAPSALLPKLQAAALQQVKLIQATETEASQRAVLLGLTLWRIKSSMAGKFTGWLKNDFDALGYRQARYYMSVALCFIEETEVELPEFLALPGDQTELALESYEGKARKLMAKISEFVDDRALGEMLNDLGIKESAAAKKKKSLAKADKDGGDEDAALDNKLSVQDRFNEIDAALRLVRSATADKAIWMSFSKQQHDDLKAAATTTAEHVLALHVKTHGRAKK